MSLAEKKGAKVYGLSMGTVEKEMERQKGKISSARNLPRLLRQEWKEDDLWYAQRVHTRSRPQF
jgi:hypothetical protein